jgi:hypothetical protein
MTEDEAIEACVDVIREVMITRQRYVTNVGRTQYEDVDDRTAPDVSTALTG